MAEFNRRLLSQLEDRFANDARSMSNTDWVCANTTLRKRPFSIRGYEFQRAILDDMSPSMDVMKCSQVGLALALDTPIPTIDGWTTMGDIQIGDTLFDERGKPCRVEYVSPVYTDHACYELTFEDGRKIVADANHRWMVHAARPFNLHGEPFHAGVINTETIHNFQRDENGARFHVTNTPPGQTEALSRRIIKVEPVASVPVRCISVNSPSHLFLAGEGMVPTHNTEIELRKALAFVRRNSGTTAIFTLPDEAMYKRVSQTRLNPILESDKVFRPVGKGVKNVSVIQVHRSFLIIAAATEQFATGQPADAVFNDEVDLSDQAFLTLFRSRMQNSAFRINQRFSTPTHVNFGIHEGFLGTDQHQYLIRCDACNKHQAPEFSWDHIELPGLSSRIREALETPIDMDEGHVDGIDLRDAYVKCHKCGAALDIGNPALREWVPTYPNSKNRRGYDVSPFVTDRLSPAYIFGELFEYKRKSTISLKGFYNTVLGKPFTGGHQRLSLEQILACFEPAHVKGPTSNLTPIVVGIDVGQTCHIVLGLLDGSLAFGFKSVPVDNLFTYLEELDKTYKIVGGCIDRHPYEPTAKAVFRQTKGRILPVEYRGRVEVAIVKDKFDELSHGQVDRTAFIDTVAEAVRKRTIRFADYGIYKETISDHLQDMIRNDDDPEKDAVWEKVKGNDHFFHAMALMLGAPKFRQLILEADKADIRTEIGGIIVPIAGPTTSLGPHRRVSLGDSLI